MGWEDVRGWFGFRETYDLFIETAPLNAILVEIGVAFGRSIGYLARKAIDAGRSDIRIVAIDPWRDDWWMPPNDYPLDAPRPTWGGEHAAWARAMGGPFSAFLAEMRTHAPEELERIEVVRAYANYASRMFLEHSVHAVMIDGNHNYEQVRQDILTWRPLVRAGGILAGDDYSSDFPGVVRAVFEEVPGHEVVGTTWRVRV